MAGENNNSGSGSDLDIKIGISVDRVGAKNELKALINELETSNKINLGANMKGTSQSVKQATADIKKQKVEVLELGRGYKQISDKMKQMYADSKTGTTVDVKTEGAARKVESFVATVKKQTGEIQKFFYTYNQELKGFELNIDKTKSENPTNSLLQKQRNELNLLKKEFNNKFGKMSNQYDDDILNSAQITKGANNIKESLNSLNKLNYGEFTQKIKNIRLEFDALKIQADKLKINTSTKSTSDSNSDKKANDEIKRLQKVDNYRKQVEVRLQNMSRTLGEQFDSPQIKGSLNDIQNRLKNLNKISLNKLTQEFKEIDLSIRQVGATARDMQSNMSWIDKVSKNTSKFFEWYVSANMVMQTREVLTDSITKIVEMNAAMVELNKVTDMSDASLNNMKLSAMELSKELGKDSTEIMASMAEFGRVTKDREQIVDLAKVATMASNVTSLSADEAAKALNTTILSMNLELGDAMMILDQFNEIQNNYRKSNYIILEDSICIKIAIVKPFELLETP